MVMISPIVTYNNSTIASMAIVLFVEIFWSDTQGIAGLA